MARAAGFLVVAIAYGGVWLAVAMFFSVVFRSTATSALCADFSTVPPVFTAVSLSDHGERPENAKWMSEDDFEHRPWRQ